MKENIEESEIIKESDLILPVAWENQLDSPENSTDIAPSEIGFAISSPVLYLSEGSRKIELKLDIENKSFNHFIKSYSGLLRGKGNESLSGNYVNELFAGSLKLSYTSPSGWMDVSQFSISTSESKEIHAPHTNSYFLIEFKLSPSDEPLAIFNPLVHGTNLQTEWPVVKLTINHSTDDLYEVLRNLAIETISIKAEVKGASNLNLMNNTGIIGHKNPFQAFGPLPMKGSFLRIGSTNVLNKYTTDLEFNIKWLDIPGNYGGFEKYYKEYNLQINNTSFKASFASFSHGAFLSEANEVQIYDLFETNNDNTLSESLTINNIELEKLELNNEMLLDKDVSSSAFDLNECILELKLISPDQGFGQKVFPQLYSEVLIANSKKKEGEQAALPNVPFIPVIKSLSADYTLKCCEMFSTCGQVDMSDKKIILLHIQPLDTIEKSNIMGA